MPWIIATTLTVFVPLILVYLYIGKRITAAVVAIRNRDKKRVGRIVFGVILYVNLYPLLFLAAFLIAGRTRIPAFSGESFVLDLFFTYPFWFGLVIAVQLALVFLLADAIRLFLRIVSPARITEWKRIHAQAILAVVGVLTIYSVSIIVKDTWTVRIAEKTVRLSEKAASLSGTKIVVVSDVQGDGRTDGDVLADYVEQINRQNPDLVLFAGDLVTSGEGYIESTARIMEGVKAPYGKYAAVGDHDMFSNKGFVIREMRKAGFVIADDTTVTVPLRNGEIGISLVTRTYMQSPKEERLDEIANGNKAHFRIFLVHQPAEYLVEFASRQGYDLFAAGHTHGGGVAFGIPGLWTFSPANLEGRYVSGFYENDGMAVVVTNGIGMTLAPIRYHAPSEITVLNLVR